MQPSTFVRLFVPTLAVSLTSTCFAQISLDPGTSYAVGTRPDRAAAGDFTGDGNADLASAVDGPDRLQLLVGDGTGSFALGGSVLLPASSSPSEAVAGDVDGDGDMDIAVILQDNNAVQIVINNAGVLSLGGTAPIGNNARGLSATDANGDGVIDYLAVANRDDDTATILTNNGAGVFSAQTVAAGLDARGTAFGDWDGDGDADFAVSANDDRTVRIYTNTGAAFVAGTTLFTNPNVRPEGLVGADVDGNGFDDIVAATNGGGFETISVFASTGAGFGPGVMYATGLVDTSDVSAGDLDCDGDMDIAAIGNTSGSMALLANNGAGVFGAPMIMAAGINPDAATIADLDGDNDPDVAVSARDSNAIFVYLNQTCDGGGDPTACPDRGDLDSDGNVGFEDLLILLSNWGPCPG